MEPPGEGLSPAQDDVDAPRYAHNRGELASGERIARGDDSRTTKAGARTDRLSHLRPTDVALRNDQSVRSSTGVAAAAFICHPIHRLGDRVGLMTGDELYDRVADKLATRRYRGRKSG